MSAPDSADQNLISTDEARAVLVEVSGGTLARMISAIRAVPGYADDWGPLHRATQSFRVVERLARTVLMLRLERTPSGWSPAAAEELAMHRADLAAAAGELMVPIPAPGSESAKLMRANRILRGMNDELHREVRDLRDRVAALTGGEP